jgi:hypothetical protein
MKNLLAEIEDYSRGCCQASGVFAHTPLPTLLLRVFTIYNAKIQRPTT